MKKLYRSKTNRKLAGICGGLAEYFGIDSTLIRLGFALFTLAGGSGLFIYLVAALIIPEEDEI